MRVTAFARGEELRFKISNMYQPCLFVPFGLVLQGVLKGVNATVFAYGATGSGKTYTMVGTDKDPGLMVLSLQDIFTTMNSLPETDQTVTCSYLEVRGPGFRVQGLGFKLKIKLMRLYLILDQCPRFHYQVPSAKMISSIVFAAQHRIPAYSVITLNPKL